MKAKHILPFLAFFSLFAKDATPQSSSFQLAKNIDVYFSVLRDLDLFYVDSIDFERTIKTSIHEMLRSLDPYTVFIPEAEVSDFDFNTTGQYGGLGMLIRKRDDKVEITEPYEGFPAQKAGLSAGDKILALDTFSVSDKNIEEVSNSLKGKIATSVTLKVLKNKTKDTVTLTLTREKIQLPPVPYFAVLPNTQIGYLSFSTFTQNCSEEVKKAVLELKRQGATSILLDLRSNTGGLLDEAINVVNFFVNKGENVVSVKGKFGEDKQYKTEKSPIDTKIPLLVLINGLSASSSEIVAGALQDLDRAVILGQKSFGKGLVQTVRPLPFNEKIKLTTAKYYTPSGRCVQSIDYSHRDKEGKAFKVPDSLFRVFKTRAGRKVYDAGGITPDKYLEVSSHSKILLALFEKGLIYDYANHYFAQRNDNITDVLGFSMKDDEYQDFVSFVNAADFNYQTSAEQQVGALEKLLVQEKDTEEINKHLAAVKEELAQRKQADIFAFRSEIQEILEEEIVARYAFQRGRIQRSLKHDEEIKESIKILQDRKLYDSLLSKVE